MEKTYNPMSKEFQDECNRLGLTGRQLAAKYQIEGKSIDKDDVYKDRRSKNKGVLNYTDEQLLWYLTQFYKKYGRPPVAADFINNPEYPSFVTYQKRFGSWSNALKLVGLDVESMVKKGIVETQNQKARLSEIIIRDHYKTHSKDLAGENQNSPCDGICPNGMIYDVKSAGLSFNGMFYTFYICNKHKDEIEICYLLGFNKDYTKLDYGWRIPGEIIENNHFQINVNNGSWAKFTVENMKQYDITDILREVLMKQGYFEKIKNYIKARDKGMTIYEYDKQL